jgi:hypothetical protein
MICKHCTTDNENPILTNAEWQCKNCLKWTPLSDNNGGDTSYYDLNLEWKIAQDVIEGKKMHWNIANIFKSCFRFGDEHHSDQIRDLNKIIWFAKRHIKLLEK